MKPYEVVGFGNALMDLLVHVEDSFLDKHAFAKGGMYLIDEDKRRRLLEPYLHGDVVMCSGGSAANTVSHLSTMGHRVLLVGSVSRDRYGTAYLEGLQKKRVDFIGSMDGDCTGSSVVAMTPDKERTMFTTLGCAPHFQKDFFLGDGSLREGIMAAKLLYIEGYLWDEPQTIEVIEEAIRIAKEARVPIGFSASDSFCVERHRKDFLRLMKKEASLFFCNEGELLALSEMHDSHEAQKYLARNAKGYLFVTYGDRGSCVTYEGSLVAKSEAFPAKVVDLTGAGDAYAAGVISAYLRRESPLKMITLGAELAAKVIGHVGASLPAEA